MRQRKIYNHAYAGLKLFFTFIIVLHHSHYINDTILFHGYLGVELFFMISGYMLYQTMRQKTEMGTLEYAKQRLSKLYPHYILSFLVVFIKENLVNGRISLKHILNAWPEILMVQNIGLVKGGMNTPCWYMSVLMVASIFIFFFAKNLPKKLFNFCAVICVVVSYQFILHCSGGSIEYFYTVRFIYLPFWRGVAGLLTGIMVYQINMQLTENAYRKYDHLFRGAETFLFCGIILAMILPYKTDVFGMLCIVGLLITTGNPNSLIGKMSNTELVNTCGRYIYAVYLNHYLVISLCKDYIFRYIQLPEIVEFLLLAVAISIYSVFTTKVVDMFLACINKLQKT